jgi:tetratricopeptide (TPR) repeat protein
MSASNMNVVENSFPPSVSALESENSRLRRRIQLLENEVKQLKDRLPVVDAPSSIPPLEAETQSPNVHSSLRILDHNVMKDDQQAYKRLTPLKRSHADSPVFDPDFPVFDPDFTADLSPPVPVVSLPPPVLSQPPLDLALGDSEQLIFITPSHLQAIQLTLKQSNSLKLQGLKYLSLDRPLSALSPLESSLVLLDELYEEQQLNKRKFIQLKNQSKQGETEQIRYQIYEELSSILASLATSLSHLKRYQESQAHCQRLITLRPEWVKGYSLKAANCFYLNDYSESLTLYKHCLTCELDQSQKSKIINRIQKVQAMINKQEKKLQTITKCSNTPVAVLTHALVPHVTVQPESSEFLTPSRLPLVPLSSNQSNPRLLTADSNENSSNRLTSILRFPRLEMLTIRDFLGEEMFQRALKYLDEKRIHRTRINGTEENPIWECCILQFERKSNVMDNNREPQFITSMEFHNGKIARYHCQCKNHENIITNSSLVTEEGNHVPYFAPCSHTGAAFVWLKKKQDEFLAACKSPPELPTLLPSCEWHAALFQTPRESQLRQHFSSLSVSDLQRLLVINQMTKSGAKQELVARCVSGSLCGVLSPCQCGGRRFYSDGLVRCVGHFDFANKTLQRCSRVKKAQPNDFLPWIEG